MGSWGELGGSFPGLSGSRRDPWLPGRGPGAFPWDSAAASGIPTFLGRAGGIFPGTTKRGFGSPGTLQNIFKEIGIFFKRVDGLDGFLKNLIFLKQILVF